jgi:hypothetical protein
MRHDAHLSCGKPACCRGNAGSGQAHAERYEMGKEPPIRETDLWMGGYDIRTVQELLMGHRTSSRDSLFDNRQADKHPKPPG